MPKPIAILLGALALASTNLPAQADTNRTVTILTMMETGKPTVSVDISNLQLTVRGDEATYDPGGKNGVTKTVILKGKALVTGIGKDGKRIDYAVKDGVAIITTTSIKPSPKPKAKSAKTN